MTKKIIRIKKEGEEKISYKIGDWFKSPNNVYILAYSGYPFECILVDMKTGKVISDPVVVENTENISEIEFRQMSQTELKKIDKVDITI